MDYARGRGTCRAAERLTKTAWQQVMSEGAVESKRVDPEIDVRHFRPYHMPAKRRSDQKQCLSIGEDKGKRKGLYFNAILIICHYSIRHSLQYLQCYCMT
jgi:hypothetical protein